MMLLYTAIGLFPYSYQTGKINRLFKRVESKSYYKDLPKALKAYNPRNGFERSLIDVMKRGAAVPDGGTRHHGVRV